MTSAEYALASVTFVVSPLADNAMHDFFQWAGDMG